MRTKRHFMATLYGLTGVAMAMFILCLALGCQTGGGGGGGDNAADECATDADCAAGETCEAGECVAGEEPPTLVRDFTLWLPLFAADSAWNQRADGAAVLPDSDKQILALYRVLLGDRTFLHPQGFGAANAYPFPYVNYDDYSMPVYRAGTAVQSVPLRDYGGNECFGTSKLPAGPDGTVTVPGPAGTIRPAGPANTDADGHLVLYDAQNSVEYDFWQATTARDAAGNSLGGGQVGTAVLAAGAVDFFDVRGPGTNPAGSSSARALGTSLLAGMILPEDVQSGVIGHALAFVMPGPRNTAPDPLSPVSSDIFYPASTTEADFYSTDPVALAAGQRIRLKPSLVDRDGNPVDEGQLAPITRMFLAALRAHGAYLADGAGGFGFTAEDIHTANLQQSDGQVNELIGQPADTPLPPDKTKWQIVIEKLDADLELIPLAYGPAGQNPATATFQTANFEVVEPFS